MQYKITTEYRHAQEGELFIENGKVRVSEGKWHSSCGRYNDQMGEVIVSVEEIVEPAPVVKTPRKRTSRRELVNA